MNWVNSSLELAGSLLESVDEEAALTLAGEYAQLLFGPLSFTADVYRFAAVIYQEKKGRRMEHKNKAKGCY